MAPTLPVRDIFLRANGLRHHLTARGAPGAPPLIMIHGLAGQAHVFDAPANRLAARYHVYCLDVRGRGESEWGPPDGYHADNYVADLEAVRGALGLDRVTLIGTSMGGLIAMNYAPQFPGRVARVVINDIGPEIDPTGLARILEYVGAAPEAFPDMHAVVTYYREHYGPMVEQLPESEVAEFARWNVRKSDAGIYVWKMDPAVRKAVPPTPALAPWDAFTGIRCPVLLLRGAQSDVLSPAVAAAMVQRGTDCRLVEVPGVGHAPLLMEPTAVAAIDTFLAG